MYFVLTRFADLDQVLSLVIGTVFGAMEWLFLGGIVRKQKDREKTIG
jgi:hypothetical protein